MRISDWSSDVCSADLYPTTATAASVHADAVGTGVASAAVLCQCSACAAHPTHFATAFHATTTTTAATPSSSPASAATTVGERLSMGESCPTNRQERKSVG